MQISSLFPSFSLPRPPTPTEERSFQNIPSPTPLLLMDIPLGFNPKTQHAITLSQQISEIFKPTELGGYYKVWKGENGDTHIKLERALEPFAKENRAKSERVQGNGYSSDFCTDLTRGNSYHYTMQYESDSVSIPLTAKDTDLEQRLAILSDFVPNACLRMKISEIAHQGALGAPTEEIIETMLSDNHIAGNNTLDFDIHVKDNLATVKVVSLMTVQNTKTAAKENLTITITRTMQTGLTGTSPSEKDLVEYEIIIPPPPQKLSNPWVASTSAENMYGVISYK